MSLLQRAAVHLGPGRDVAPVVGEPFRRVPADKRVRFFLVLRLLGHRHEIGRDGRDADRIGRIVLRIRRDRHMVVQRVLLRAAELAVHPAADQDHARVLIEELGAVMQLLRQHVRVGHRRLVFLLHLPSELERLAEKRAVQVGGTVIFQKLRGQLFRVPPEIVPGPVLRYRQAGRVEVVLVQQNVPRVELAGQGVHFAPSVVSTRYSSATLNPTFAMNSSIGATMPMLTRCA